MEDWKNVVVVKCDDEHVCDCRDNRHILSNVLYKWVDIDVVSSSHMTAYSLTRFLKLSMYYESHNIQRISGQQYRLNCDNYERQFNIRPVGTPIAITTRQCARCMARD